MSAAAGDERPAASQSPSMIAVSYPERPVSNELTPHTELESIARRRERIRGYLAIGLVALFALTIAASFLLVWLFPYKLSELKDVLPLVLTPVTSVVSAVLGFYYGAQARREE